VPAIEPHPAQLCVRIRAMQLVFAAEFRLIATGFLAVLCLAACASPARRADDLARRSGFTREVVTGNGFLHRIYRNTAAARIERAGGSLAAAAALHVYIEGDGTPYRRADRIAADPTPRDPLMLRLMALDRAPSVYLGRPCYFEPDRDPACRSIFWTLRRYGPEVLASMEAVLSAERDRAGAGRVVLFGHSGGGTLAVLLAQRADAVARVVTIGANLDLAAWCRLHHYSALTGSEDPVAEPPRAGIQILHLVGADDRNTPPVLVIAAARARGGEPVRVIAHQDHNCCWETVWPGILAETPQFD
jgi:hypothetical protein